MNLAEEFAGIFAQLEKQKTSLLRDIGGWREDDLFRRPSPEEWSVVEMLDHLVKTEFAILGVARSGLSHPRRIGVTDRIRTRFLENVFRSERRVKVPKSASQVLPAPDLNLPALIDRWNGNRFELKKFIHEHDYKILCQGIFRHPVAGWMGMKEILQFFSVHLIHHNHKLARIQSALDGDRKLEAS